MQITIEVRGLEELRRRMRQYPQQFDIAANRTMEAALLALQEKVPPYPPQPSGTRYVRTGTLGRSLGSGMMGGNVGRAQIFQVRKIGQGFEGRFGTALEYAPYVIGEQGMQSGFMSQYWWQLSSVPGRAFNKIKSLFEAMANSLAKFLDGKGL